MTTDNPEFSNLAGFARWFLAQPLSALRPPRSAVYGYRDADGVVSSLVLYRRDPYQVELIWGAGPGTVPEHSHRNVDSIEVILSGDLGFILDGRRRVTEEHLASVESDGSLTICGQPLRVRPNQRHGAIVGPRGAAFLSIQRWLNGVQPTSVGLDWDGAPHIGVSHHE